MKKLYKVIWEEHTYFVHDPDCGKDLDKDGLTAIRSEWQNGFIPPEKMECVEMQTIEDLGGDSFIIPWSIGVDKKTCADYIRDLNKSCDGKIVEIEGRKYKITEIK